MNEKDTLDVIEDLKETGKTTLKDRIIKCRSMMFNITYSSIDDIYIVVRLQRLASLTSSKNYINLYNVPSSKVIYLKTFEKFLRKQTVKIRMLLLDYYKDLYF